MIFPSMGGVMTYTYFELPTTIVRLLRKRGILKRKYHTYTLLAIIIVWLVWTYSLSITMMNREFEFEKLRLSTTKNHIPIFSLSFDSMHIRAMERVFICTNHTIIVKREYDIFF